MSYGLQLINIGSSADSSDGDSARNGGIKINTNFVDVYTQFGDIAVENNPLSPDYGTRVNVTNLQTESQTTASLHPAGYWQKIKAANVGDIRSSDGSDANIFPISRGEQIIIDFSDLNDDSTFNVYLPIASKGDVVKIRDAYNTLTLGKKLKISTTPLIYLGTTLEEWKFGNKIDGINRAPNPNHVKIGGISRSYTAVDPNDPNNIIPIPNFNTTIPPTDIDNELIFQTTGINIELVYGGDSVGWTVYKLDPFDPAEELKGKELYSFPLFNTKKAYDNQTGAAQGIENEIIFNPLLDSEFRFNNPINGGVAYWEGGFGGSNTVFFDDEYISTGNGNSFIIKNVPTLNQVAGVQYEQKFWEFYLPYPKDDLDEESYESRAFVVVNDSDMPFVVRPMWKDREGLPLSGKDFVTTVDANGVGNLTNYEFVNGVTSDGVTNANDLLVQFDANISKVKFIYGDNTKYTTNSIRKGWIITEIETKETFSLRQREYIIIDRSKSINGENLDRFESEIPVTKIDLDEQNAISLGGIYNIVSGIQGADPLYENALAKIEAIDLEVYVNGDLLVQGNKNNGDYYPFIGTSNTNQNTLPLSYGEITDPNLKRLTLFDSIHFNEPLLPEDHIKIKWKTLEEIDAIQAAAILDLINSQLDNIQTQGSTVEFNDEDGYLILKQGANNLSASGNLENRLVSYSSNWDSDLNISIDGTEKPAGSYSHKRSNSNSFVEFSDGGGKSLKEGEIGIDFKNSVIYSKSTSGTAVQIGLKKSGTDTKIGDLTIQAGDLTIDQSNKISVGNSVLNNSSLTTSTIFGSGTDGTNGKKPLILDANVSIQGDLTLNEDVSIPNNIITAKQAIIGEDGIKTAGDISSSDSDIVSINDNLRIKDNLTIGIASDQDENNSPDANEFSKINLWAGDLNSTIFDPNVKYGNISIERNKSQTETFVIKNKSIDGNGASSDFNILSFNESGSKQIIIGENASLNNTGGQIKGYLNDTILNLPAKNIKTFSENLELNIKEKLIFNSFDENGSETTASKIELEFNNKNTNFAFNNSQFLNFDEVSQSNNSLFSYYLNNDGQRISNDSAIGPVKIEILKTTVGNSQVETEFVLGIGKKNQPNGSTAGFSHEIKINKDKIISEKDLEIKAINVGESINISSGKMILNDSSFTLSNSDPSLEDVKITNDGKIKNIESEIELLTFFDNGTKEDPILKRDGIDTGIFFKENKLCFVDEQGDLAAFVGLSGTGISSGEGFINASDNLKMLLTTQKAKNLFAEKDANNSFDGTNEFNDEVTFEKQINFKNSSNSTTNPNFSISFESSGNPLDTDELIIERNNQTLFRITDSTKPLTDDTLLDFGRAKGQFPLKTDIEKIYNLRINPAATNNVLPDGWSVSINNSDVYEVSIDNTVTDVDFTQKFPVGTILNMGSDFCSINIISINPANFTFSVKQYSTGGNTSNAQKETVWKI